MGTNRVIKTDGNLDIESSQTNITGDLDVTGSINNFNFPASDGINGQALTTNGSGTLSFSDVAGGGAGGINYIENTRATTDTTGYATYADAAATTPVDGTGGSATITFTRNTTTPLRDGGDFKIAKDAANRQGEGVGYAFTIDNADKARKLLISFDYDASDSDYADDDIKIFVFDVTNSNLIRVNGEDLKGGKGKHYAQFQTASDSTSYRLIFHVSSTNASAYDVFLDEISVGPQNISHGTIITDWESYTPTLSNVTIGSGAQEWSYRRVGSDIEITGTVGLGSGSSVSGDILFSLPSGYSLDLTKYADNDDSDVKVFGLAEPITGSGALGTYSVYSYDNQNFKIQGTRHDGTSGTWNATFPLTWAFGHTFNVRIKAPILGWSSNAAMSEDFSGRDVVARYTKDDTQTFNRNTETKIEYDDIDFDTTNSMITTGADKGTYIIPETGYYNINARVGFSEFDTDSDTLCAVGIYVDNAIVSQNSYTFEGALSGGSRQPSFNISETLYLEKNQEVYIYFWYSSTSPDATEVILSGVPTRTNFSIAKRQSAQTVLDTETVAARLVTDDNTFNIPQAGADIIFDDIVYDTHNAYDTATGEYTVPTTGYYSINCKIHGDGATYASGDLFDCQLYIAQPGAARVLTERSIEKVSSAGTHSLQARLDTQIYLVKGSKVSIRAGSTATTTLLSSTVFNVFTIARIK